MIGEGRKRLDNEETTRYFFENLGAFRSEEIFFFWTH